MTSRNTMRGIASLLSLLMLVPLTASGQSDSSLDQAYQYLVAQQFQPAENIAKAYLVSNPRRYRAEFIIAVAECRLNERSIALQRLAIIKRDYVLDQETLREVNGWVDYCTPQKAPESPSEESNVGFSGQAVTQFPQLTSATPDKIDRRPLPLMGGLVPDTSYSGDDYNELKEIASATQCAQICRVQAPCRSMTYAPSSKTCWLKRSVPPAQHGAGFVSSVKQVH
jgi:hypothetical protein